MPNVWATSVYDDAIPQSKTLREARVGFVGFGHIGQLAWELFRAFGSSGAAVTGSGRVDAATHGLRWAGDVTRLDPLPRESDIVVVTAPLTEATKGMIGAEQLRALGPDGVLINVGRGPLVDEHALFDALRNGDIRAAAIDVWYRYPAGPGKGTAPGNLPFGELANLLMTPTLRASRPTRSPAGPTTSPPTSADWHGANRSTAWCPGRSRQPQDLYSAG